MSVSIKVYEQGERLSEDIHEGTEAKPLFDLIDGSYSHLIIEDADAKKAKELSKEKDYRVICIDDTNGIGAETKTEGITEYVVEFDAELHRQLTSLIK